MTDTPEPYKVLMFATEEEWREYVGGLIGRLIGREQDRTRSALRRAQDAEDRVLQLEREVQELTRELHTGGTTPL